MSAGAIRAGQAFIELTTRDSELQKGLKNAQAKLRAFGVSVTQIGRDLLMLSGAVAAPLILATRTFANFDDQMRMVRAVTGATGKDFDMLTEKAKKLGRETSFTASQVASGMLSLGRMGFSPQEIDAAIAGVMNLAKATGTDLGSAAEIAGNNLRVFNMNASKMGEVVDLMTVTANGSAQTLEDLGESLKMAGPLAQRAGADLKDTCAALGILANMGIRGSLAGTALGKSYKRLADPKVIAYLRQFDIATVDNAGNLRRMRDILVDISKVMKDMPSAERITFAENVFDARGSLGGGTLALNTEAIDLFVQKLDAAEGAAAKTAQEMEAGIGGSIRRLLSALEGVGLVIGEIISKSLVPMVEILSRVFLNIRDWIAQNSGLITVLAQLAGGGLALGATLVAIGAAAKGAALGVAAAQTALKGLAFGLSACVTPIMTLGKSLSLLIQAFANYRNAAIPAMIGTSKLLAALNLPIDVRAKQIAAGLLLMSNAEAAAAAKTMLAAKWQAAVKVMQSFSAASLMAAAATRVRMLAEVAAAAKTKVLVGMQTLAGTVTAFFSAANWKAAASATAGGGANLFLAMTTKAVAAGYLAAGAAAAAFCAIPISWILGGVSVALIAVVWGLRMAAQYTAELSDKMKNLRQKGDDQRISDQTRMERLKQLAEKQKLSNVELAEAENLIGKLKAKYGDFGAGIDAVAGKLTLAADAQEKLNELMKRATLSDLEAEIAEYQTNIKELHKEDESLMSYWNHNMWSRITGKQADAIKQLEINGDRAVEQMKKIGAARERMKALQGGNLDALTGDGEKTQENLQAEKQRQTISAQAAADAESRVADIDKQLAKERRSELENEIIEVQNLNSEYKKLIQTMLDVERSKADALQDKDRIAQLEMKLRNADSIAAERRQRVLDKHNQKNMNQQFDQQLKQDPAAAIRTITDAIRQFSAASAQAAAEFNRALTDAARPDADGGVRITDDEQQRIDAARAKYEASEAQIDSYRDKLRSAEDQLAQMSRRGAGPIGSYSAREVANRVAGAGTAEERTAKAAEQTVEQLKKTNELLRNKSVTFA